MATSEEESPEIFQSQENGQKGTYNMPYNLARDWSNMTVEELNEAFEKEFFQKDSCSGLKENKPMTGEDGQNNGTVNEKATAHKALSQHLSDKEQQYVENSETRANSRPWSEEIDDLASLFGKDADEELQDTSHAAAQGIISPNDRPLNKRSSDSAKERENSRPNSDVKGKGNVISRGMFQVEKGHESHVELSRAEVSSSNTETARGIRTCLLTFPQLPQTTIPSQTLPLPSSQQSVETSIRSQSKQSLSPQRSPHLAPALPKPLPQKRAIKPRPKAAAALRSTPIPAAVTSPQQLSKLNPQLEAMFTLWENSYFADKECSSVLDPLALQHLQLEKVQFRDSFYAGLAHYGEETCKEMIWSHYNQAMDAERN